GLGAVRLAELLEDRLLVLGLDADAGVAHLDVERAALGGSLDADVTLLGELERVADEVPDDDRELSRIGAEAQAPRVGLPLERHRLGPAEMRAVAAELAPEDVEVDVLPADLV